MLVLCIGLAIFSFAISPASAAFFETATPTQENLWGLVRSFPFVDYACTTEGDVAFPAFLDAIERGVPVAVPGIVGRESDGTVACAGAPPVVLDLDALPFPDYSDFFEQFHFRGPEYAASLAIPMEASRGCWWGQKHHCTFCGLNGETMRYRSKSPQRVVAVAERVPPLGQAEKAAQARLQAQVPPAGPCPAP